ncbi:uncharacterized protein ARMOST_17736 [Armillaria ostoyae]|uniref:Uncharacterized protein n=1 Tax=Armillaria ostoyae TaxID=47428 RepID=A0A284RZV8_ARMOS|nr:uncharacterized protein ARMOST_17736 [Armillaria ostoyae]
MDLRCPVFVEETTLSLFTDVASAFVSLQETALHRQLPCFIPRLLRYLAETFEDNATSNNTPFTTSPLTLYRSNFPKYEAQLGKPTMMIWTVRNRRCRFPQQHVYQLSVLPPYNERFKHHASLYIPSASFHKRIQNTQVHDRFKLSTQPTSTGEVFTKPKVAILDLYS